MPITRSTAAVAIFCDSGADVLNGNSTRSSVTRPTIQVKKNIGRGVATSSRCDRPVASSAAAADTSITVVVCASPYAPSWDGDSNGTLNSHRHTTTPTRAMSAATTAVAAPPAHSWRASTTGRVRPAPSSGMIGLVIWYLPCSRAAVGFICRYTVNECAAHVANGCARPQGAAL